MAERRSASLDLARGIGILWMLLLHLGAFYHYYAHPRLGLQEPFYYQGWFFEWTVFNPIGEQIFIALAMVNLTRGSDADFRLGQRRRRRRFAWIAGLCLLLQFLAWSESMTAALSFSPIFCWMLLLSLASELRARAGLGRAVMAVGGLMLVVLLAMVAVGGPLGYGDALEQAFGAVLGVPWEYNARPEYFLGAVFAGLAVPFIFRHVASGAERLRLLIWTGLGCVVAIIPWVLIGKWSMPVRTDVFSNEYAFGRAPEGQLFVAGVSGLLLLILLAIDRRGWKREVPLLNWMGRHAFLIFAIHGVFQSRVLFPLHVYLAGRLRFAIVPNDLVLLVSVALTLLFSAAVIRGLKDFRA